MVTGMDPTFTSADQDIVMSSIDTNPPSTLCSSQPGTSSDFSIGPAIVKPNPTAMFIPIVDQGRAASAAISGSHDLLSLFNVSSVYDRFVKPYLKPLDQSIAASAHSACPSGLSDLKGKGKADVVLGNIAQGRNSIKKDHQLQTWIMDPNFQESSISNFMKPFASETLAQAFTFQPGTLPGFDSSVWIAEEGGPKRKRKKRKQGDMAAGNEPVQPNRAEHQPLHGLQQGLLPTNQQGAGNIAGIGSPVVRPHNMMIREEEHRKKKRTKLTAHHQVAVHL